MKVYELMNKVNVENIGIRLSKNIEDARNKSYENSSIMYWGSLDDMPAEYAGYKIVSSNIKNSILFCWCIEDTVKVKDILETDHVTLESCNNITFHNYISKHDAYLKNHTHSIIVHKTNDLLGSTVIDADIHGDTADVYIFTDNIKSNIFDKDYKGILEFYEM